MALNRGRWTHEHDGGLAVFVIGMRLNRPWRLDQWGPVLAAMPRMLVELSRHPEWGMLGYRVLLGRGGPVVVQYWRSAEAVHAYASDPAGVHRPAWSAVNRRARAAAGAVGLWHETFDVAAGACESIYVDTPPQGLAAATSAVPVTAATSSARQRIARGRPSQPAA